MRSKTEILIALAVALLISSPRGGLAAEHTTPECPSGLPTSLSELASARWVIVGEVTGV